MLTLNHSTRAFENLRTQAMKSREEIEDLNRQVDALRSNAMSADRELAQAKALLMAAEKGGIAAIDELKSTDKMISKSLKAELDSLRGNYNFVVSECEAQKSQLIEALLAKEKLRKEVEDGKESPVAMITDSAHASVSETIKKSGEKIEKLRERLKERKQVSYGRFTHRGTLPTKFARFFLHSILRCVASHSE